MAYVPWDIRCYVIIMVKLSDDNKAAIVNGLRRGLGVQELADRYGVTRKTIQRIKLKSIPRVVEVDATPMDLDTVTNDPEKAIEASGDPLDPARILTDVERNLAGIHAVMYGVSKDERFLLEDRARCAKVAVDANTKRLTIAAMIGGSGAHAVEGETPELDAIRDIVEGK